MGAPSVGSIVLVPFPFSDLSNSKKRPAVVIASASCKRRPKSETPVPQDGAALPVGQVSHDAPPAMGGRALSAPTLFLALLRR
jgi:hypothetical protein